MFEIDKLPQSIDIGFTGEHQFRSIQIDMTKWMSLIPGGTPYIVHIRPGQSEADAYVATTTFANNILTWNIAMSDLGNEEGTGIAQVWLEDATGLTVNHRGKSARFATVINNSAGEAAVIPSGQMDWEEQLATKVNKSDVANNLTTTQEGKVLDARQGKALDDKKVDIHTSQAAGKFLQTDENGDAVWDDPATDEQIAEAVTDWLDENVPTGTTVVVDSSLTIEGAAADSKKTGTEISSVKSALSLYQGENEKDFTGETIYNTLINSSTNKWSTSNNYQSYIFAVPTGTTSIKIKSNSTNGTPFAMLKNDSHTHGTLANYATGTGRTFVSADETKEYSVPSDCKYIWILKDVSGTSYMPQSFKFIGYQPIPNVDDTLTTYGDAADAKVTGDEIDKINRIIESIPVTNEYSLISGSFYQNGSNTIGGTPYLSNSSNGKYGIFDISYAAGGYIEVETASLESSSTIVTLICDSDHKILSKIATSNFLVLSDGVYKGGLSIPSNAKYIQYSVYKGSGTIKIAQAHKPLINIGQTMYVSADGSDDNDGESSETAKATVTAAIRSGARVILVKGGSYTQSIDFSGVKGNIRIATAEKDGLPVFYAPSSMIAESETAVSGTTKVYSAEYTKTLDSKVVWIFQDGVPDANTEITAADRHPLSRGKQYRCGDTKIVKCSANNTADAITEIENASGYKWYLDDANDTIYFSRPQSVTESNPIRTSTGESFLNNIGRGLAVELFGLCAKYQYFNLMGSIGAVVSDCSVHNAMSEAGFRWNMASGTKLYRCEASQIFYSTTSGDGFNAHSAKTGDAFAHQTTCMLFDCWGHDCCDDGYSDHERCEISIYGGLFENNGGGGVTPAQGSHCTCYNVLSRYNSEADFFYTGNPSVDEGGVGGQIACFNCVSKGSGTGKGFRLNGSAVQGLFVNCVCMNRETAFYSESNGGTQVGTLINCSTVDCTTQKSSIYTVKNGTLVS